MEAVADKGPVKGAVADKGQVKGAVADKGQATVAVDETAREMAQDPGGASEPSRRVPKSSLTIIRPDAHTGFAADSGPRSGPGPRHLRGRIEEASPADLAWRTGVPPGDILESLRKEGFRVDAPDRPLGALAGDNSVSPAELFASLVKQYPELGRSANRGGFGQGGWSARGGKRGGRSRWRDENDQGDD